MEQAEAEEALHPHWSRTQKRSQAASPMEQAEAEDALHPHWSRTKKQSQEPTEKTTHQSEKDPDPDAAVAMTSPGYASKACCMKAAEMAM